MFAYAAMKREENFHLVVLLQFVIAFQCQKVTQGYGVIRMDAVFLLLVRMYV